MTPEEFRSKFKQHAAAKKALSDYYQEFQSALSVSGIPSFDSDYGWSLGPAGAVMRTKEMLASSSQFAKFIAKALGARYGDENDLTNIVQEEAHLGVKAGHNYQNYQAAVVQRICDSLTQDFEVYLPNSLVFLAPNVKPLRIGSVRILRLTEVEKETQAIIANMTQPRPDIGLAYDHLESNIILTLPGMGITIPSSRIMWAIEAPSSKTHVREEALWRIGVAISLMRLRCNDWDGREPRYGTIEINPTIRDQYGGQNALTRNGTNLSAGGGTVPGIYFVDGKVSKELRKKANQTLFDSIFSYQVGALSEQLFNALGWLAKGRQATDRSERLLYFFTAIEAVLTREDKNSPVIDTIARHGAVAMARTAKDRPFVAQRFKQLYSFRSATVHRGARTASVLTVTEAQKLAEWLVAVVLKKCDVSVSHKSFCDSLAKASYGAKWP